VERVDSNHRKGAPTLQSTMRPTALCWPSMNSKAASPPKGAISSFLSSFRVLRERGSLVLRSSAIAHHRREMRRGRARGALPACSPEGNGPADDLAEHVLYNAKQEDEA